MKTRDLGHKMCVHLYIYYIKSNKNIKTMIMNSNNNICLDVDTSEEEPCYMLICLHVYL